jgi:hypothetical protein
MAPRFEIEFHLRGFPMRRIVVRPPRTLPDFVERVEQAAKNAATDATEYARRCIVRGLREDGFLPSAKAHGPRRRSDPFQVLARCLEAQAA